MALVLLTPDMTNYTAPEGYVYYDLDGWLSNYAWEAFAQDITIQAALGDNTATSKSASHFLQYRFGSSASKVCSHYRIYRKGTIRYPISWKLQGADWGSGWTDLHTVTDDDVPGPGWTETYELASPASYQMYRILFTDWHNYFDISPDVVFVGEVELYGTTFEYEVPAVSFEQTPQTARGIIGAFAEVPAANLPFSVHEATPVAGPISMTVPAQSFAFTPNAVATMVVPALPNTTLYRCTLTGAPDGVADVVLPIASFTARLRGDGSDSYISVVVPDSDTYGEQITARTSGQIVIERGARFLDGSVQFAEIGRVDLEEYRNDTGGTSGKITISGHLATTTDVPKTVNLEGVSYLFSGTAATRVRATMALSLKPGDTVVLPDSTSFVAGLISHYSTPTGEQTEITEA